MNPSPPALPSRHANRRGLSLLELLVVLVVLAVLSLLAFSTLGSAREDALKVKCASNLRRIGVALHAYMADHDGQYPPNRFNHAYRERHNTNGAPYPQQILKLGKYLDFKSPPKRYTEAGVLYCPADKERPVNLSIHSYGQNQYLGGDARTSEDSAGAWAPWMSKPVASEWSGRLIYMIDHDFLVTPKRTAGLLTHQSWPLPKTSSTTLPGAGKVMVHFRHRGVANALMVDGSVRGFRFNDLVRTYSYYIWGGDY